MAEYGKLFSRIWSDEHFTALDGRSQQVYCLLISYSTRNLAGVLPLTLKRWAKATADATTNTLTRALCILSDNKFVAVDWETEEVLIRTFIRNDEVYRQPNLMEAARKFALQIESQGLRWVLHDELMRLPDHKHADKTALTANRLVEGLSRTLPKPFDEPFAEPIGEPPGVGVSYVGKGNTSTYNEHQPPTPAPHPDANPDDGPLLTVVPAHRTTGSEKALARFSAIPSQHSQLARAIVTAYSDSLDTPIDAKTGREIAQAVDTCIQAGQSPAAIAAGIELWAKSDSFAPSQIGKYVTKAAAARRTNGIGKPTEKASKFDAIADKIIAEMDQTS